MCESVYCIDETTPSFSPNGAVFSWFHHSDVAISFHNTGHWLFLASRWNCLRFLWSRFSPCCPLFWLWLLFRLRCEWWTHHPWGYKSTQKLGFIAVKHRQTAMFLFHCEHSCLMSKFSVNMPTTSATSRTFSRRSSSTILWIFFTISGAVISFCRPLRC